MNGGGIVDMESRRLKEHLGDAVFGMTEAYDLLVVSANGTNRQCTVCVFETGKDIWWWFCGGE